VVFYVTIRFVSDDNEEGSAMAWELTGNAGTTTANFLGTTDSQPLAIKTNNSEAMRIAPGGDVGIGTATPTQRLTLGSGNIFLPNATEATNGNLYFGGTTDTGQIGMRLFGGNFNGSIPSGFIDVRAGTLTDGLIFRVDTSLGGTERMRITASGTVEVPGTLNVGGDITMPAADFAEDFQVAASVAVEPGMVMVLDEDGVLRPSYESYDRKVAGVISGAGHFKPGLILDRQSSSERRLPLALVGKVCCKADATSSQIGVGDLLTTSRTPGHAMKAIDPARSFGAVIGKALRPLESGCGLIPILVALQ
jgi:hypothetical protein